MSRDTEEKWDVYDADRRLTGKKHTRGVPLESGHFHLVVEVITINRDGKMLLTKRDAKKTHPLLWESTGGSVLAGETMLEGAVRELKEETGLKARAGQLQKLGGNRNAVCFLDSFIWRSDRQLLITDLTLQAGEVCDAKFAGWEEIVQMNEQGLIVPAVWQRFRLYEKEIRERMGTKI